jgi:hypothetical protein
MSDDNKTPAEVMEEATELARQLWDDILVIFNGAGTFTPAQTDGYAVARIASALAEVIHQRNAGFFHIGDVWAQRNQAVGRAEKAEARLAELVLKLEGWRQTFGRERINVIAGKDVRAALSVLIAEYEGGEHG